jgi:hypothetical protein
MAGIFSFVRACLEIPIHGVSEPFLWGVWVSLSQKNFDRYVTTYDHPDRSGKDRSSVVGGSA